MAGIFTSPLRLKDSCLDALSSRLARWTKPLRTSSLLATLTNLGKSKSQLIAENAHLRHQLGILKQQVKRPPVTRTDRILLVLLARVACTLQQALVIVQPDTRLALVSRVLPPVLEAPVQGLFPRAETSRGNDCLDQRDGQREHEVRSGTAPLGGG